jgi:NitT/TauT family transport system substrate-binding protein
MAGRRSQEWQVCTMNSLNLRICAGAVLALSAIASSRAAAQDKVSVGVFPVSSSLPYFVAHAWR